MKCLVHLMACLLLAVPASSGGLGPAKDFTETPWPGEASFRSYGPEDGLNSSGISSLAQDTAGLSGDSQN